MAKNGRTPNLRNHMGEERSRFCKAVVQANTMNQRSNA
ncbi:unnamed protein product [Spirodela intermedia]|nr:unnamed protein product [Spirodela intermedia]CAA6665761.1 unnamed protein product [Spirodela intermedia]